MLESLLINGKEHSTNIDRLHKGARLINDMTMLLQLVGQNDRRFMPSFVSLDLCINGFDFARTIFKVYLDNTQQKSKKYNLLSLALQKVSPGQMIRKVLCLNSFETRCQTILFLTSKAEATVGLWE